MRHLTIALLACAISFSAIAGETTTTTDKSAKTNEKPEQPTKVTKQQDAFTRAADETKKAATPSAIALANFLKKNGMLHEKTEIKAADPR